ncbi:homeobox-leucine zipper protein ATHB-7-like [Populus nigra]|uniref:homeobox-leucine zipper protein ATHB-7-like n=1 Tax=Populus nigra TaxID=3691 RepID=UPI002B2745BE|nr:homeobox-leucine zipper protein ATHB-7-like [Populus nigra]
MFDGGEYSPSATEPFSCLNSVTISRKKKNKIKRRFSDEQIKSLETMFESETRLEPRKKMQLARELGLQPRQVAIWFQNKRARWKSKQLERDYSMLRANYNSLASRFETLKKEKQALAIQLQKLNDLMKKPVEEGECCGQGAAVNSSEGESENGDATKGESETKPRLSIEQPGHGLGVLSDEDSSIKVDYFELEEEPNLMSMVEPAEGSLTSQEDWGSIDSDGLFDQSSSGYQWWDFWA